MASRLKRLALVALIVIGLDQLTKALAAHFLAPGPITIVPGFFDLILVHNQGAAFSLLSGLPHSNLILMALSLVAMGAAAWMVLSPAGSKAFVINCLGLIVGGALGNFIDRVRLGAVVDFMDLHWEAWHWPVFNVADLAISLSGCFLALQLIRGKL